MKNKAPDIISVEQHNIRKEQLSTQAISVLETLADAGYSVYLVGGCVRDLLCGIQPTDFDVATDAKPEQVREVFRRCRLIGRRFRLVHVYSGRDYIEVATFRKGGAEKSEHGMLMDDNIYGSMEEDALRRDFTVNALYYCLKNEIIIDYVGGVEDLKHKRFHMIGDPKTRYREDPVRMMRAVRLMGQLGLSPDESIEQGIIAMRDLLLHVPPARLFEEMGKLLLRGNALSSVEHLSQYGLFDLLLPEVAGVMVNGFKDVPAFFEQALMNTDNRVEMGKPLNPAFLLAVFFWPLLQKRISDYQLQGMKLHSAKQHAIMAILSNRGPGLAIPKRFTRMMREIWILQYHLPRRAGKRAFRVVTHPRFRAAYDFLVLRARSGEPLQDLADWWTVFQTLNECKRLDFVAALPKKGDKFG